MTKYTYLSHVNTTISRDKARANLQQGQSVTIECGKQNLRLHKVNDLYTGTCQDHNSRCDMLSTERAFSWAEEHLRQHH